MATASLTCSNPQTLAFYRDVLTTLGNAQIPVLIGGTFAFEQQTGISRPTKDLDLFVAPEMFEPALAVMRAAGYLTEATFPHWLGKIRQDKHFVDVIFGSANGLARVDADWFKYAIPTEVVGLQQFICPVEETILSKSFLMERERYDGADVAHLFYAQARFLDWDRLVWRFGDHWRVLLSYCILFGFIYPAQRWYIPSAVINDLLSRLQHEMQSLPPSSPICQGTLLSREQYLVDLNDWGLQDARVTPLGTLSNEQVQAWTAAIGKIP